MIVRNEGMNLFWSMRMFFASRLHSCANNPEGVEAMGRRSGFEGFVRAAARASAAAERERQRSVRMQLTQARQLERQHRMAQAQQARSDREAQKLEKAQYLADRQGEVDDLNAELVDRMIELEGLLTHTLTKDDRIDFDGLRLTAAFQPFDPPQELSPGRAPRATQVAPPSGLGRFLPGAGKRYAAAVDAAAANHRYEVSAFNHAETVKRAGFLKLKEEYERSKAVYDAEVQQEQRG